MNHTPSVEGIGEITITKASNQSGFTLMELLIVMAIIALAGAILIPRISNNESKIYQAQLSTLLAALNHSRRQAVILNRPYDIILLPYTPETDSTSQDVSESRNNAGTAQNIQSKYIQWHSQGATLEWKNGPVKKLNRPVKIRFFPQGGASGGVLTLIQGKFNARIKIDGMTGKITLTETFDDEV